MRKDSFWADAWNALAFAVALMSGITSIAREYFAVFRPAAVAPSRLFNASLLTCILVSYGFLFWRQRLHIGSFVGLHPRSIVMPYRGRLVIGWLQTDSLTHWLTASCKVITHRLGAGPYPSGM